MHKTICFLLVFICSTSMFTFGQNNSTPNYIPKGWRIPKDSDFKKGSGWHDFKSQGNPMPFFAAGDFNGDNMEDYAWNLIKQDNSTWGIFIFLNKGGGKFTQYYIGGKGKDAGSPGTLYTGPVNNTVLTRFPKGEYMCSYDNDGNVKKRVKSKYESISFGVYEAGENISYYFDKALNKFFPYSHCEN